MSGKGAKGLSGSGKGEHPAFAASADLLDLLSAAPAEHLQGPLAKDRDAGCACLSLRGFLGLHNNTLDLVGVVFDFCVQAPRA